MVRSANPVAQANCWLVGRALRPVAVSAVRANAAATTIRVCFAMPPDVICDRMSL